MEHCMQAWPELGEEARITSGSLDSKQIRSILAGPSILNFGTCSSNSKATRSYFVSNTISNPIHIVIDAQAHEHLSCSQHCSQECVTLRMYRQWLRLKTLFSGVLIHGLTYMKQFFFSLCDHHSWYMTAALRAGDSSRANGNVSYQYPQQICTNLSSQRGCACKRHPLPTTDCAS